MAGRPAHRIQICAKKTHFRVLGVRIAPQMHSVAFLTLDTGEIVSGRSSHHGQEDMPLSTLGVAHRRVPGMRHENTMSTDFPALPTFHGSIPMIDPEDVALLLVDHQGGLFQVVGV